MVYSTLHRAGSGNEGTKRAPCWLESAWRDDAFACEQFRATCGTAYARWLIDQHRISEALIVFSDLTTQCPNQVACTHAWYWLALEAHMVGDTTFRNECARRIQQILLPVYGISDEWKMFLKAILLMNDLRQDLVDPRYAGYGDDLITKIRAEIDQDLDQMPADLRSFII